MLNFDPDKHHRRSIRLKGYDHSLPGAYFITILTNNRNEIFGEILGGEMRLNELGLIVAQTWEWLPEQYPYVELDHYIVMPNHFHGILRIIEFIDDCKGGHSATCFGGARPALTETIEVNGSIQPTKAESVPVKPLGQLIGAFKTISAKQINLSRSTPGIPAWHRNCYDHIIRNEGELRKIWDYIDTNPLKWEGDRLRSSKSN